MENRIKEQQLGLFSDRTSSHAWWANQFRLLLSSAALRAPGSAAPHWPKGEPVGTCPGRNHPFAPAQERRHCYTQYTPNPLVVELEVSSPGALSLLPAPLS